MQREGELDGDARTNLQGCVYLNNAMIGDTRRLGCAQITALPCLALEHLSPYKRSFQGRGDLAACQGPTSIDSNKNNHISQLLSDRHCVLAGGRRSLQHMHCIHERGLRISTDDGSTGHFTQTNIGVLEDVTIRRSSHVAKSCPSQHPVYQGSSSSRHPPTAPIMLRDDVATSALCSAPCEAAHR